MDGRTRALGPGNGPLDARILFVAEAPGRLGADRTGVPLQGDATGRNFEELLAAAELNRDAVFITNAVLCNPRDAAGRNVRPAALELQNCREKLVATVQIIDPLWVVALGAVALATLGRIGGHGLSLATHVATAHPWRGRWLVPMYHPGPRSVARRGRGAHLEDYRRLGRLIRGGDGATSSR